MGLQQLSSPSLDTHSEESPHSDVYLLSETELQLLELAARMSSADSHDERSNILHSMKVTRINLQHLLTLIRDQKIKVTPRLEEILQSQIARIDKKEEMELRISS